MLLIIKIKKFLLSLDEDEIPSNLTFYYKTYKKMMKFLKKNKV